MNRKPTHDWWPPKPEPEPPENVWKAMTLERARIGNEPWDTLDSHWQERALNQADDDLNQELSERAKRIKSACMVLGIHPQPGYRYAAYEQMRDEYLQRLSFKSIRLLNNFLGS